MADPKIPATPQQFSFGGRLLYGLVTSYEGDNEYRSASHTFLKRDGGIEEPMGRSQRRLSVQLAFVGPNCAAEYEAFAAFIDANRTALLIHPVVGRWTAFCKGPNLRINFSEATNKINVPVAFVESHLDATVPKETPNPATAAQNATDQQTAYKTTLATFCVELAKLQTQSVAELNSLDSTLSQVTTGVTAPVTFAVSAINIALGAASSIRGVLADIQAASDALDLAVTAFVSAAIDLFDGANDTIPPGTSDYIATTLGTVQDNATALEDILFSATPTPAGCADAIADVEVMVDMCMTLSDAVAASLPPTAYYVVPATQSVLVLAQRLIDDWGLSYDAMTYASSIMGLNRIPNPAAIPGGTQLLVATA